MKSYRPSLVALLVIIAASALFVGACGDSPDTCGGNDKRICLVPLGHVSRRLVRHLVDYHRDQYGLEVRVLTAHPVPEDMTDPVRQQVDAIALIEYMGTLFPEAYDDPNAVLIGLTPVDLFDRNIERWRFVFGAKGSPANPQAIISTFRMDPENYSYPRNDRLLYQRARKYLSRYIGLLFYGLPPTHDPQSLLYDSILGLGDLDTMQEPLPVGPLPEQE